MEEAGTPVLVERTGEELHQLQCNYGPTGLIVKCLEKGVKPKAEDVRQQGPEAQRLTQLWNRLVLEEGVLKRKYDDATSGCTIVQLVVPPPLREEVLKELHSGALEGHMGEEKTLHKAKERFYWPGMQRDVQDLCKTCDACATRKKAPRRNHAPLVTIKAGYPMQVVAVDILGPLPESESGNSFVLVAGDYFTKWMEAYPIHNQEAETVARKLVDEMFCRFSPPEQLHSDQGRQFESGLIKEICNILRIKKTRASPYHPQCDGLVERFNRTLLDMLATTTKNHPFDWEDQLRKVCMAYNTSVHSSTGFTPFYLMFGRQANLPIDLMYGTGNSSELQAHDYAKNLKRGLQRAYQLVRERLGAVHERRKAYYDRQVHGEPFQKNEFVWLHSPVVPRGQSKKLHHPWTGPYRVMEKLSDSDYKVKHVKGGRPPVVVHFDRLKLCRRATCSTEVDQNDSHQGKSVAETQQDPVSHDIFGKDLELVGEDPPEHRYPRRNRHAPDSFAPTISH